MANNRVAYGLAKEQGIDTKDMSPKEVWDALAKKGITQESVSEGKIKETKELQSKSVDELKEMAKPTKAEKYNKKADDIYAAVDRQNKIMADILKENGVSEKEIQTLKENTGLHGNALHDKIVKMGLNDEYADRLSGKPAAKSTYKIDFNNYDEDIDWDTAAKNEKLNGNKGKNESRKDKYGNPLVSDEAFNVGVDAVKGYLDYMSKDGYDHKKLKSSNIYADALQNVISKAITEAGYNPASDITETDFNEIIGTATGEEYKTELDRTGSGYKRWTGKAYTGYKPKK